MRKIFSAASARRMCVFPWCARGPPVRSYHIQLKMEHELASEHHRIKATDEAKNMPKSRLGPPPRRQPPRRMSCAHYFQLLLFRSKKQSRECQRSVCASQPACLPSNGRSLSLRHPKNLAHRPNAEEMHPR